MENRYLLNVMFCALSNCPTKICDSALSALYTVSRRHISDVRTALQAMCEDSSVDHHAFIENGIEGYRKHNRHPMNLYPNHIRERIETHLDMVLRADPAGGSEMGLSCLFARD